MKALERYIQEKYLINIDTKSLCDNYNDLLDIYNLKEQELDTQDKFYHYNKSLKCSEDLLKKYMRSINNITKHYNKSIEYSIDDVLEIKNIMPQRFSAKTVRYSYSELNIHFTIYSKHSNYALIDVTFYVHNPLIKIWLSKDTNNKILRNMHKDFLDEAAKIIDYILNYEDTK